MYNQVYIDYYGGAHGNFLEYVINRYIFDIESANFNPFVASGASHNKTNAYEEDKRAFAGHYSNYNLPIPNGNNLVVQIYVDVFYPAIYNSVLRAGDVSLDIDDLENDTLSKLKNPKNQHIKELIVARFGEQKNYPRKFLRNIFYSKFHENKYGVDLMNTFNDYGHKTVVFPFSAFYNYNRFVEHLGLLSTTLGKISWSYDQSLLALWEEFISRNRGNASYNKCEAIIDSIIKNENREISCNLIEEAYINSYITKSFNLHSNIDCFEDMFVNNTGDIYQSIINQIANNRQTI